MEQYPNSNGNVLADPALEYRLLMSAIDAFEYYRVTAVPGPSTEGAMKVVIARIRRLLEARGIAIGADYFAKQGAFFAADALRTLARDYVEEGDPP